MRHRCRAVAGVCLALPGIVFALSGNAPPDAHVSATLTGLRSAKGQVLACLTTRADSFPDCKKDPLARNANADASADATDANRAATGKENILVMTKVCTHLGCIPLDESGEFGGWFCPCHGSVYDTAGRIRKGPAPENLPIPPYAFLSDTKIRIG